MVGKGPKLFFTYVFIVSVFCPLVVQAKLQTFIANSKAVLAYYNNGNYLKDVGLVANGAQQLLSHIIVQSNSKKLAAVFDVDETMLSNFNKLKQSILAKKCKGRAELKATDIMSSTPMRLEPVYKLYQYCMRHHIAVFIITGEKIHYKNELILKLHKLGYSGWTKLVMRKPGEDQLDTTTYKASARKQITTVGYKILLNISDQYADLHGGYAEAIFKLPNPFYYVGSG